MGGTEKQTVGQRTGCNITGDEGREVRFTASRGDRCKCFRFCGNGAGEESPHHISTGFARTGKSPTTGRAGLTNNER